MKSLFAFSKSTLMPSATFTPPLRACGILIFHSIHFIPFILLIKMANTQQLSSLFQKLKAYNDNKLKMELKILGPYLLHNAKMLWPPLVNTTIKCWQRHLVLFSFPSSLTTLSDTSGVNYNPLFTSGRRLLNCTIISTLGIYPTILNLLC